MSVAKEPNKLYISEWKALTQSKCPRCRVGRVFTGPTYSFKTQKMNETCPHCGLKFEREPGYFYVAMFVSYAMNVIQLLVFGIGAYILGLSLTYENLWYFVGVLLIGTVLCSPFNYRYSRLILLYWLSPGLNYEPGRAKVGRN